MSRPDWRPAAAFAALSALILGPLLLPGYILTLDMVFTPQLHYPLALTSSLPYHAVISALNLVLPGDIIQKLLLLAIFTLAGLGMHRLVATSAASQWARYAASLLYVVNPFTYGRFMAGQYLVLAGYALMPWFVAALLRFIRQPGRGTALRVGLWAAAIGFTSLHTLGFSVLVAAIALVAVACSRRHRPRLRQVVGWGSLAAAGLLVVNSFWLVPTLLGRTSQAALISGFDTRHLLSFRTDSDPALGQIINTLGLHGFWADREGLYLSPKTAAPYWWLVLAVILALAALGVWKYWRRQRLELVILLSVLAVALVLAQGIMGSPFAPLNAWLYDHLPFLRGYREPGKFVGLIALVLAYAFGLGVAWLQARVRRPQWLASPLPGLLVALPILYTQTMLWGATGQLRAVDYPRDWYALSARLQAEPSRGQILFLPWHQYLRTGFAGRLIANPAQRFFGPRIIQGDNAEIGLIERQTTNPASTYIEQQILAAARTDVAARLSAQGITRVVLAKEADYLDYAWLDHTPGLRLQTDSATLRVYEVSP